MLNFTSTLFETCLDNTINKELLYNRCEKATLQSPEYLKTEELCHNIFNKLRLQLQESQIKLLLELESSITKLRTIGEITSYTQGVKDGFKIPITRRG